MLPSKEVFRNFCSKESSLPLFLTFDWMQTVAFDNWDVAVEERKGEIIGIMPYMMNKKMGLTFIEMPPFTPIGGLWIKYPEGQKYHSLLAYEKDVYSSLIEKLPRFDSFIHKFHPYVTNWLPFYWKNFQQFTAYTYIISDLSDKERVFRDFKDDVRRNIKNAEKTISVKSSDSIDILYDLKVKSYKDKRMKLTFSKELLEKIFRLCKDKNCGELLIAGDRDHIHSATLFVWDKNTCYNLITASDPQYKKTDAVTLIIWEALQRYSKQVNEFNFEGSMVEGIESFFRSFGGKQVPYFVIRKTNSRLLRLKEFLKEI